MLQKILSSRLLWIVVISCLAVLVFFHYSKKIHDPHYSSTAAPALIEPARQLEHGRDPYLVHLDQGAPVSPGPGWIILLAPLTLVGGVSFLTPLCLAISIFLVANRNPTGAGVALLLILLQPLFISVSFLGHDIFAIPLFFAILCMLAERLAANDIAIACLAVLAGAFGNSRLPMVMLLFVLGIGLHRLRPRAGSIFLAVSLSITLLLHAVFYLWARKDGVFYQPLHLFRRAAKDGYGFEVAAIVAGLAAILWIMFRMRSTSQDWILAGGLLLAALFVPIGFGELVRVGYILPLWEGSSYISFGLSLFALRLGLTAMPKEIH